MVTMIDEIFDRAYRSTRNELNSSIDGAFARIGTGVANVFRALNRIQFDSPWATTGRTRTRA
jgi:hypothetical protein